MTPRVRTFPDPSSAAVALAEALAERARSALAERGRFALALSGGSTPEPLFRILAAQGPTVAPWNEADLFWADERAVPPDDGRSNYGLADRLWLRPAGIPARRLHRIHGEAPSLDREAARYEAELRGTAPPDTPSLDVALLGIGPDGHTASLFPGSQLLGPTEAWVAVEPHPGQPPEVPRITLTLRAINRARHVVFLVTGDGKREVLGRILRPAPGTPSPPAAAVHGLESTEWYVDRAAAGDAAP